MKPLIKWPGGKSGEIEKVKDYVPKFERYFEPFFGGGAMFFFLEPPRAAVNDASTLLMEYYGLVKARDALLRKLLLSYDEGFASLYRICSERYADIYALYDEFSSRRLDGGALNVGLLAFASVLSEMLAKGAAAGLVLDEKIFAGSLAASAADKIKRTATNDAKKTFPAEDLKENLLTGFMSGFYRYFRGVCNGMKLGKTPVPSAQYRAANFYFIREYCYGSMFRYNSGGEFNIPYGGISYNAKNFRAKIDNMFSERTADVLAGADISCCDFEDFLDDAEPSKDDFIFLDPPYDTDFSDYSGRKFGRGDQRRLASLLKEARAKIMLVIKRTDFILDLYKEGFYISSFGSRYRYNVRSRNERSAEHLVITNFPL